MSTITLDANTLIIPASVRDAFKAAIVNAPCFPTERDKLGKATRDLTKADWVLIANALGIGADLMALINGAPPTGAERARADAIEARADADPEPEPETPSANVDLDAILDVVRPVLSTSFVDRLATALAPVIAAANKPPVEIERIIEIEKTATGETVRREASKPVKTHKIVAETNLKRLFPEASFARHGAHKINIWDGMEETGVPKLDPFWVPDAKLVAKFATALERMENIWLYGPMGSGKSTLPEEYAARTRRPFCRIAFQRSTETLDLVGCKEIDMGTMRFVDGVFTQAIRRAGTVVLLDELMFAPPGITALFQTVIDKRALTLSTGDVVRVADGVVFVVADNSNGTGNSGIYSGLQQANAALVDRFGRMLLVDYLEPEHEASALRGHTQAPVAACKRLVEFVGKVRVATQGQAMARPISLRRMVAFVRAWQDGFTAEECWDVSMLSRLDDADRETLRQTIRVQFDNAAFNREMNNEPPLVEASTAPEQQAARAAFDPVDETL